MKQNFIFIAIFLSLSGFAQRYYNDSQLWTNLYLEKKVTKCFDVHLKLQGRGTNNFTQVGQAYADIGVTFRISKNIKLLADYAFAQKAKNIDSYRTRHVYYTALIFKKDFRRWRFSYRNMFQCRYNSPKESKEGHLPHYYDRNKITVKYEATKRFSFYTAEEVYIPLNNPQIKGLSRSRS